MKSSFHWGMKSAKTALNNYLYPRWGNLVWFIFPSYCLQSAKHWAKYIFFFFFFCYFCLFVRLLHFFFLCRNCFSSVLNSPHSLFSLCAASLSRCFKHGGSPIWGLKGVEGLVGCLRRLLSLLLCGLTVEWVTWLTDYIVMWENGIIRSKKIVSTNTVCTTHMVLEHICS